MNVTVLFFGLMKLFLFFTLKIPLVIWLKIYNSITELGIKCDMHLNFIIIL
jgi:hypothetical protein